MINLKKQQGLTAISIAFLLVTGGFAVLIALKLLPVYIENFNVSSHVKKVNAIPSLSQMSDEEIISTLIKRFGIDNVENVKGEHIVITRDGAGVKVDVDYEVRKPTLGNVDVVVVFSPELKAE